MDIDYKKLIFEKIKFGKLSDLSDSELLSIILDIVDSNSEQPLAKSDVILKRSSNDLSYIFTQQNHSSLINKYGFTSKQTIRVLAIGELIKRVKPQKSTTLDIIKNSKDISSLFDREFTHSNFEEFWVVYLNNGNRVIDKKRCSDGNISSVAIDSKIIIRHALNILATKMILLHNHPSGNLIPSDEHIELTKKVEQAAAFFDISLLDHIIISPEGDYYSFNDVK